jgi:hypothetical protein
MAESILGIFSGDTSDLMAMVEKHDPKKMGRRSLDGLKTIHIRVALSMTFVEAMVLFLRELCKRLKHTVYLKKLYDNCVKTQKETGAELLASTFNMKQSDITGFFAAGEEEKKKTKTSEEDEEDENDWIIIPDPEADEHLRKTNPQKYELRLKQRELKGKQMIVRYQKCRQWLMCFWEQVKPLELQKLIRERNEDLFRKPEIYKQLSWFQDENWLFGLEVDGNGERILQPKDMEGNPISSIDYPHTTAQAFDEIIMVDGFEQKAVEKKRLKNKDKNIPDAKSVYEEIWYRLNNALLLAEVEASVDDASVDSLLQFIRDLYDEVEQGKVEKVSEIPQLIIQKIQSTMPMLDLNSSVRLFDFLLEAVFQNVKQFRYAFRAAKDYIPESLFDVAKLYGWDLKTMDISAFMEGHIKQLTQVRKNRQEIIENGGTVLESLRSNIAPVTSSTAPPSNSEIGKLATTLLKTLVQPNNPTAAEDAPI